MAAGERTVKIRFTGDAKGLDVAAGQAKTFMSKFRKTIGDGLASLKSAGEKTAGLLASGLEGGLKTPYVGAIIAGVGAAIAIALASAIGAGLAAALGVGVVGAALAVGIKGAAEDPRVQTAIGGFTTKAKDLLKAFSDPFREPIIRAMTTFGKALDSMRPTLIQIGQAVAPIIDKLAPAFADMAKNSLPGVEALIKAATPFFVIIAEKAPALGAAMSSFFEKIAEGGPGAQQFLKDLFNFLIWVIPKVGALIGWLSNYYITWRKNIVFVINVVTTAWSKFYGFFAGIGTRIGTVIGNAIVKFYSFRDRVAQVWNSVVGKIASAVRTIESWWNRLRALASAPINFAANVLGGIPGLGRRASGGPVAAGRSYLVGERGPEIVTMGGNGHVTPNHALSGPETLELTLDLGEGISKVFSIKLRDQNRNLKRRATARFA